MFRTLIYPSAGSCDYSVELPHWCNTDTTPTQPHRNSNTHPTKNTTNAVIQQKSRKPLMLDILMSETCWAHKKWNKIASDIKLVFYYSTIDCTRMSCCWSFIAKFSSHLVLCNVCTTKLAVKWMLEEISSSLSSCFKSESSVLYGTGWHWGRLRPVSALKYRYVSIDSNVLSEE